MKRWSILFLLLAGPAFADDPLERLIEAVRAANVSLDYVNMNGNSKDGITLVFLSTATAQQKQQAKTIVDNFDMTPIPEKSVDELMADYDALPSSDQKKVLAAMAAFVAKSNPKLVDKWLKKDKGK